MPESDPSIETALHDLEARTRLRIEAAGAPDPLEAIRVEVLGRKGALAQISRQMGQLAPQERAHVGKLLNAVKTELEAALHARKAQFDEQELAARLDAEWVDLTLPAPGQPTGSLHPITQIQTEIEDLFISMGFAVLGGPEVETEYNNFDATVLSTVSSGVVGHYRTELAISGRADLVRSYISVIDQVTQD